MMHIYYGDGKGKTTAALGLGMRAHGAGLRVTLVQFFKDNRSSELGALPFDVYPAPAQLPFHPGEVYRPWVDAALAYLRTCPSEVLLLDELLDIVGEYISTEAAVALVQALAGKELVLTGHRVVPELFAQADYITQMQKQKHPFDCGVQARKGIEY